jgi:hypothetical protein
MKLKPLLAAGLLAAGVSSSYAAAGDVVFSSDFGAAFGSGTSSFAITHSWADVASGLFTWEVGVVGTGPISITSVTFNGVAVDPVPGFPKIFSGTGSFGGGPLEVVVMGMATGKASYGGSLTVAVVPEPETYALMLAGLGAIGFMARRRQRG